MVIPDHTYCEYFRGSHADQLDQAQSHDACATGGFRIGDIGTSQRHVATNTRFIRIAADSSLNFSAAKSGLKQDGVIVDQETRVDFLPHSHGLERNAIYVQAGSA